MIVIYTKNDDYSDFPLVQFFKKSHFALKL